MEILSKINHQISGKGPRKLAFLHGVLGSGNNWSRIVRLFDPNEFTILTYDQRGHGRSFQPQSGYGSADFAGDLLALIDALSWKQIDLIGHSMGGRVALTFAGTHSQRLRSLTVEDISVGPSPFASSVVESYIERVPTPFTDRKAAKNHIYGPFLESLGTATDAKDLANFFYANLAETPSGAVDWRFNKSGILESLRENKNKDRSNEWTALKLPVFLIRGENSKHLTADEFQRMLSLNPHSKGAIIPGAGHWVHFDQPQPFFDQLSSFLKSV